MNSVVQQLHPQEPSYVLGNGLFKKNESFVWNPDLESNPHLLIWGSSGSGKSHLLRELIQYLHSRHKHIHLVDLHGDLKTPYENVMQFGGYQYDYGINPFQFDATSENAGPKNSISVIISMFRSTYMPNMGGIQELVLRQLFSDTYLLAGLDKQNPATWMDGSAEERTPDLKKMLALIQDILNHFNGANNIQSFMDRELRQIKKLVKKHGHGHDLVHKKHQNMIQTISEFLSNEYIQTPEEKAVEGHSARTEILSRKLDKRIDLTSYSSKKALATLESLAMYAHALSECGIFHSTPPPVRSGVVNRYDLTHIADEVRSFFVEALVYKIFRAAQTRGEYSKRGQFSRGSKVDTYIILDEIQAVLPTANSEKNLPSQTYNRVAAEARKYGLGLIVVTQSPGVFPMPILANITKRIGLKTSAVDVADAKRKLGVNEAALFNHLQRPYTAILSNKMGGYDPVDIERL